MPLASSRVSTSRASKARVAEAKEQEKVMRRNSGVGTRKRRGRGRDPSPVSTTENKENRTSISKTKREESPGPIPYFKVLEERGGAIYTSPRLTRSASKKKKPRLPPTEMEERGGGVALTFSPPDQKENEAREKREIAVREYERVGRIEQAKQEGRKLVYDRHGNLVEGSFGASEDKSEEGNQYCLDLSPNTSNLEEDPSVGSPKPDVSIICSPNAIECSSRRAGAMFGSPTSKMTDRSYGTNNEHISSEINSLKETMVGKLAEMQSTNADTASLKLNLETQTVKNEALKMAVSKLEENKQSLESKIEDIRSRSTAEKEELLCEKTKLEAKVEATKRESNIIVKALEQSNTELKQQISSIEQDKQDLRLRIAELEKELKATEEKLITSEANESSLRALGKNDNDDRMAELERISTQFEKHKAIHSSTLGKIADLKKKLEASEAEVATQKDIHRQTESELQKARIDLAAQKDAADAAEKTIAECRKDIIRLNAQIQQMQQREEQRQLHFQRLNESTSTKYKALVREDGIKRQRIEVLEEDLARSNDSLALEKDKTTRLEKEHSLEKENSARLEEAYSREKDKTARLEEEHSLEKNKSARLEEAYRELEDKLKRSEANAKLLQNNLEAATEDIENLSMEKKKAVAESYDASENLKEMEATLEEERETIRTLEGQLRSHRDKISALARDLKLSKEERDEVRNRMETFNEREEELLYKLVESERMRRELHNHVVQLKGNIRVFARIRPILENELKPENPPSKMATAGNKKKRKHDQVGQPGKIFHYPSEYNRNGDTSGFGVVQVREPMKDRGGLSQRQNVHTFAFDMVFPPEKGQDEVWLNTEPFVQSAIDGHNVCLFAYGQTGSGKTHTMLGEPGNEGIISRSVRKLFHVKQEMEGLSRGKTQVSLSVELLEVYNENVYDLLAPSSGKKCGKEKLEIVNNEVVGNIRLDASSEDDVNGALALAQENRCVKATNSNDQSSRSHLLFTIHFNVTTKDGVTSAGKLHVCDLAGSERLNKSGSNTFVGGDLLKETQNINSSLSVLSRVIESLQEKAQSVPFRESRLTMLLKDSLGGNSKTLAIICCNPLPSHHSETVCSLKFAERVAKVELKAMANVNFGKSGKKRG